MIDVEALVQWLRNAYLSGNVSIRLGSGANEEVLVDTTDFHKSNVILISNATGTLKVTKKQLEGAIISDNIIVIQREWDTLHDPNSPILLTFHRMEKLSLPNFAKRNNHVNE